MISVQRAALIGLIPSVLLVGSVSAAPRDIQITSVDYAAQVVTLHNFGVTDEPLTGYRFCTHDDNESFRYGNPMSGGTIEAGTDYRIHWLNDAPGGSDSINISTIGGNFATPLDNGPWGMGLYFPPVSFGNGNTIADHVQWSIGGVDHLTADGRSDAAEMGGVWTDQTLWVSTTATTELLQLKSASGGSVLHGPADYDTFSPITGDINGDFLVNSSDLGLLIGVFGTNDPDADLNNDNMVNSSDLGLLIGNFGMTNP